MSQSSSVATRSSLGAKQKSKNQTVFPKISPTAQTEALAFLGRFRDDLLDPVLKEYFDSRRQEFDAFLPDEALELYGHIENFVLRSGKRFRSALMYVMYEGLGGTDTDRALRVSMVMELMHSYLLVHDDILDQDDLRRGKPSMHRVYEMIFEDRFAKDVNSSMDVSAGKHFGISMGILAGDILSSLAYDVLSQLRTSDDQFMSIFREFNHTITRTGFGEMIEMYEGLRGNLSEDEVLRVYDLKTAEYTMRYPIVMGATLAGASQQTIELFEEFAHKLGIAFQIQDDVIGMWGNEETTGKPVGSDVMEGKETLIVWHARQHANPAQMDVINQVMGNSGASEEGIAAIQKLCEDLGSRAYVEEYAQRLRDEAWDSIRDVELSDFARKFLEGVSEYIVSRRV